MNRSPNATVRIVALVPTLILVLLSLIVTTASADAATDREFAVEARALNQTMETTDLVFTLPEPGRGSVTGMVAEADDRRSAGKEFVAFSRSFASSPTGTAAVPVTLSARALTQIRERGLLRVTLRTEFTPAGFESAKKYRSDVTLRPFAMTANVTDDYGQTAFATLRTPRPGRLAVKFHLRDRVSDRSTKLKTFTASTVAGGSYTYSAPLTDAARRAIIIGKVVLMVTARFEAEDYSARMLRSRLIRCRYCGVR